MGRVEDFCDKNPKVYPVTQANLIPGATFGYRDTHSPEPHLTVVLTSPALIDQKLQVVIVNLTKRTSRSDLTTEITKDEHPFAIQLTVVAYNFAKLKPVDELLLYINNHLSMGRRDFKPKVLEKIKRGLLESEDTPIKVWEYCKKIF